MDKEFLAKAKKRFDRSAEKFYQSGTRYLAALDALIEIEAGELKQPGGGSAANNDSNSKTAASAIKTELKDLRSRRRQTEELFHKLFSDEFADTCSAVE